MYIFFKFQQIVTITKIILYIKCVTKITNCAGQTTMQSHESDNILNFSHKFNYMLCYPKYNVYKQ